MALCVGTDNTECYFGFEDDRRKCWPGFMFPLHLKEEGFKWLYFVIDPRYLALVIKEYFKFVESRRGK